MRALSIIALICVTAFVSENGSAQSISYLGFECLNAVNVNDPTPTASRIESRFEVIEIRKDGMLRLSLSGGLPRFVDSSQNICIDSDTAIGFIGTPNAAGTVGLPLKLDRIEAVARINEGDLVIVVNSIFTDLSASRGAFSSFSTSRIQPVSNTLFLKYDAQIASFILKKIIHNKGFVQTNGSTAMFPFIEIIVPIFDEAESEETPRILTPPSEIVYRLDG
ncbi:hypothetical protein SAMN05421690_100910 [Nitrosomonas sp. Nm51]|uniref:hypothetical protein n=1 Tax=Nitrosomonas sp. Nm51 TaxID=133720 RepID=UPI0008CC3D40|nr:hypothetical protein [Nitrosomonas sp. Nm51]SER11849.1 hypothetical protein SAMN05421690_100910 [Nitrosomonas sp. Nm51]